MDGLDCPAETVHDEDKVFKQHLIQNSSKQNYRETDLGQGARHGLQKQVEQSAKHKENSPNMNESKLSSNLANGHGRTLLGIVETRATFSPHILVLWHFSSLMSPIGCLCRNTKLSR